MSIGFYFWRRSRSTEGFTVAGRSLPGWVCGLSIFATYLSSISYLALPGKSFADNWNPFVFSLSIPIATWIAVRWFLPYYRASGEVSAYALLEHRFGVWARLYASVFYLLTQIEPFPRLHGPRCRHARDSSGRRADQSLSRWPPASTGGGFARCLTESAN